MSYKFLSHTADVKFKVKAKSLEQAFIDSASALIETISKNEKVKPFKSRKIYVKAKSLEQLFYKFIEEFLYLIDAKNFVASNVESLEINLKEFSLTAKIIGDNYANYAFTNEVKAMTYNELKILNKKNKTIIFGVFDV